jgi:hypothetical protein
VRTTNQGEVPFCALFHIVQTAATIDWLLVLCVQRRALAAPPLCHQVRSELLPRSLRCGLACSTVSLVWTLTVVLVSLDLFLARDVAA